MTPERHFFGWGRPFGAEVIDWLWARKSDLPGMLIVVPTAQSGRRLREQLAERGAILAPRVVTTGFLMRPDDCAPDSVETVAWAEVFSQVKDWSGYSAIFPSAPEGEGWELGLARAMVKARAGLQENGLLFATAAVWLKETPEGARWAELAKLERQVEGQLREWGLTSKNVRLADGELTFPSEVTQVVVAGVLDLPKVGEKILEKAGLPTSVLLTGEDPEDFDLWGRPKVDWNEREIAWPKNGSVELTGDSTQQAEFVLRKVAEGGEDSSGVVLGTGDEEISQELVHTFGGSGWVLHDPGAASPSPVAGFLRAWRSYIRTGKVVEVLNLLAFSQSGAMAKGKRAQRAISLSQLRDQTLARTSEDLERGLKLASERFEKEPSERTKKRLKFQMEAAEQALETVQSFENWRKPFLAEGFHETMARLLPVIDPEDASGISDWLEETAPVAKQLKRSAFFWLDLLLESLNPISDPVPAGRTLDVQGWLELLHDPAPHLVICGMNEGRIPGKASTDTWLSEGTRRALKLANDEARAARDAYILTALIRTREATGRVDLIAGKSTLSGDMLQPSRLLLAAKGQELARRVKVLFREVEPADTALAWEQEPHWKWKPRKVEPKARVSVTAISAYLACPFRYYLERVVGMNDPAPDRVEWTSQDFGNIMHDILETWGLDEVARDLESAPELKRYFLASLDAVIRAHFGEKVPLAIQFQIESMKQRFGWLAREQEKIRKDGWQIVEIEKEFSLEIEGTMLTGKIDRIDRHEDGRIRVLDYKTSKNAKKCKLAHLVGKRGVTPSHLEDVDDILTPEGERWINVQVPLYAAALERVDEVGYFALGEAEADVKLALWDDFGESETKSALKCTEWVLGQIRDQVFWPPAEKENWGKFDVLTYGRTLEGAVNWEGGVA